MTDWHIEHGDCLAVLRTLPDACVDSVVTDPPAGIAFMGKAWDTPGAWRAPITSMGLEGDRLPTPTIGSSRMAICRACGGRQRGPNPCECDAPDWDQADARAKERDAFIGFMREVMAECLRVLKPGGYALVWALPRTSHWTGMAIELGGFDVRDRLAHLFGSGMPKSANVARLVDRYLCTLEGRHCMNPPRKPKPGDHVCPETEQGRAFAGLGTGLKPACEDWWIARKPLLGTIARNILEVGTAAMNIDGCRIEHASAEDFEKHRAGVEAIKARGGSMEDSWKNSSDLSGARDVTTLGRWPANVVLSHTDDCILPGDYENPECAPDCPVALLDAQSGNRPGMSGGGKHKPDYPGGLFGGIDSPGTARGDSGGASRFFYVAKPNKRETEAGCEALPERAPAEALERDADSVGLENPRAGAGRSSKRRNHHPTKKGIALMRWLVRLVTPRGGVVLDPFMGSGSTGCAAVLEGCAFAGIEQDPDYVNIARARLAHWSKAS